MYHILYPKPKSMFKFTTKNKKKQFQIKRENKNNTYLHNGEKFSFEKGKCGNQNKYTQ